MVFTKHRLRDQERVTVRRARDFQLPFAEKIRRVHLDERAPRPDVSEIRITDFKHHLDVVGIARRLGSTSGDLADWKTHHVDRIAHVQARPSFGRKCEMAP